MLPLFCVTTCMLQASKNKSALYTCHVSGPAIKFLHCQICFEISSVIILQAKRQKRWPSGEREHPISERCQCVLELE